MSVTQQTKTARKLLTRNLLAAAQDVRCVSLHVVTEHRRHTARLCREHTVLARGDRARPPFFQRKGQFRTQNIIWTSLTVKFFILLRKTNVTSLRTQKSHSGQKSTRSVLIQLHDPKMQHKHWSSSCSLTSVQIYSGRLAIRDEVAVCCGSHASAEWAWRGTPPSAPHWTDSWRM